VIFEVEEAGGKAHSPVESVLVDAQNHGSAQARPFLGLALGELVVNAFYGGAADVQYPGESGDADAVVMRSVGVFAERFAAMPAGEDAGQRRNKGGPAIQTSQTAGVDDQAGRFAGLGGEPVFDTCPCCGGVRLHSKGRRWPAPRVQHGF